MLKSCLKSAISLTKYKKMQSSCMLLQHWNYHLGTGQRIWSTAYGWLHISSEHLWGQSYSSIIITICIRLEMLSIHSSGQLTSKNHHPDKLTFKMSLYGYEVKYRKIYNANLHAHIDIVDVRVLSQYWCCRCSFFIQLNWWGYIPYLMVWTFFWHYFICRRW